MRLGGYRYEPLVLALVALAALPPISLTGPQDRTRYELTRHVVLYHTLRVEPGLFDRAVLRRTHLLRQGAGHVVPRRSGIRDRAGCRDRKGADASGSRRATSRCG